MLDNTLLALFIPTFALVSATPGMCMTLALNLGLSIGLRRTLWMMWGELAGVGLVSVAAVLGIAALMLQYPALFVFLKYLGGAYLIWLGIGMWRKTTQLQPHHCNHQMSGLQLSLQGFVTAIANPKGWAFTISLLPPFINDALPLAPQLTVLVGIILMTEFTFLLLYAAGGTTLARLLSNQTKIKRLNQFSGLLMISIGLWLALG